MTSGRPLLLGHRGARRQAPENTLAAFDLALAHGCDGFEFDLRRTADQYAVLCHDPQLAGLRVAGNPYSALLEKQRLALPSESSDCHLLPCLEDVTNRYGGRAFLDIELKVAGMEEKIIASVEPLATKTYVVSSFLSDVLQRIHALQPGIPLGFICDQEQTLAEWQEVECNFVIPERKLVSAALIDEIHDANKKVFVWTVNDEAEMLRVAKAGVDAIISDDTELLSRAFS